MMSVLRIAVAQMNPTVGDLNGNVRRIVEWLGEARKAQVDLVAFPELAITGYLPEDLLFKPQFIAENLRSLDRVVEASAGPVKLNKQKFQRFNRDRKRNR